MIKINYFNEGKVVDTKFYGNNFSKETYEAMAEEHCSKMDYFDYEICNPHDIKE